MTELIIRPDWGKHPYRLRCRFTVDAYPNPILLERAKYQAADLFIEDMRKQDWEYVSSHGFKMTGPYPAVETVTLPKRSAQAKWHTPSKEVLQRIQAGQTVRAEGGSLVKEVPKLSESEKWEYELAGVFLRDTIRSVVPDLAEEMEGLRKR